MQTDSRPQKPFLLQLADALRPLDDPVEIQAAATHLLGAHLSVDRVYFVEIDDAAGTATVEQGQLRSDTPSLVGRHRLSDLGWVITPLRSGEVLVISDVATSPLVPAADRPAMEAANIAAHLSAPLVKGGVLIAALCITEATERDWTEDEVDLVRETSERIWAAIERARAIEAVRDSEERFRRFGEASSDVLWIRSAESLQWEYLSPGFQAVYGRDRDEVLREDDLDTWVKLIVPEDRDSASARLKEVSAGRHSSFDYRVQRPDGEIRWLRTTAFPIVDADRHIRRIGGIARDVTQHEHALADLRASRDFTDAVLDTVAALVIVLAPDGRIRRFNAACENSTGFEARDVVGKMVFDTLIPIEQREAVKATFHQVADTGTGAFENDWLTADGARRRISWTNTTLTTPTGEVEAIIGSGIDITDHRVLEQRLAQTERLNAIGRLAAGIAHDINNTLALFTLRADRLRRRHQDPATRSDLDAIQRTVDRTRSLIGDVLTLGRRQRLAPQLVDLGAELTRLVDHLVHLIGPDADIEITLQLQAELSSAYIDPASFEDVIVNLGLNARDAMPDGGTITITVDSDPPPGDSGLEPIHLPSGDYATVTITDTGVGIDPDDLPHIFEPYFTTKPATKGTGLGLATTYGTIIQSGGAITVNSQLGESTTFALWLPTSPDHDAQAGTSTVQPAIADHTIMVVEDDAELRQAIVDELVLAGYHTKEAGSGTAALTMLDPSVDVLVTDVFLPDLTGPELVEQLANDIRVLFISGADPAKLGPILPDSANLLPKPFSPADLLSAVRSLL